MNFEKTKRRRKKKSFKLFIKNLFKAKKKEKGISTVDIPMGLKHKKLSRKLGKRGLHHAVPQNNVKRHDGKKSYLNYYSNQELRRNHNVKKIRDGKIVSEVANS